MCIVYVFCGFLIKNGIWNWLYSPAVLSIENKPKGVSFFPFPAVTVCNTNQIKTTALNISAHLALKGKFTGPEKINTT